MRSAIPKQVAAGTMPFGHHAFWKGGWWVFRRVPEVPSAGAPEVATTGAPSMVSGVPRSSNATSCSPVSEAFAEQATPLIRFTENKRGLLRAQHEGAFCLEKQRSVIAGIRDHFVRNTRRPSASDDKDVVDTLKLLRFLSDLEEGMLQLHKSNREAREGAEGETEDAHLVDEWSAMEFFCRPWIIQTGRKTLLRIEEHVPYHGRMLCLACAVWGVPLGSLLAWVTLQSPKAWCKLHMRRILGTNFAALATPSRVRLDAKYHVTVAGEEAYAVLDKVIAGSVLIRDVVQGELPSVLAPRLCS